MFNLLDIHSDKKPSDAALNGILRFFPCSINWIADLEVPIDKGTSIKPYGCLLALNYWRDGKSGEHYPSSWKFLLDTVKRAKGPEVAQKILKEVE